MSPFEQAYQVLKDDQDDPRYRPILMGDWGEDDYGGRDKVGEQYLPQILRDWRGGRSGTIGHGANRYALVGDKTVEKIPQSWGYAQDRTSLAMINALASLGYPILPERPIATNNPRFFPTEQDKVDTSFRDYLERSNYADDEESQRARKEYRRAFMNELRDLDTETAESDLGYALELGDIIENEENVGYDKDGNLVAIDPFVGNAYPLQRFGKLLHSMTGPVGGNDKAERFFGRKARQGDGGNWRRNPHSGTSQKNKLKHMYQHFKNVNPMQLDSFTQLYHDQEQFKPWDAAEQKLLDDPSAFGEYEPNPTQREQLENVIAGGRGNYRAAGNALRWMNTPPEQKRLYEFGDNEHARRYRYMLDTLNKPETTYDPF